MRQVTEAASTPGRGSCQSRSRFEYNPSLNVLGIYYQRRYVRRKDVLELWAVPVLRALLAGDTFIAHREADHGMRIWPQLQAFGENARKYTKRAGLDVQIPGLKPNMPHPPVHGQM